MAALLLRSAAGGSWPAEPALIEGNRILRLASIGLACTLRDVYVHTYLAQ
jgi:hypothetical protein